MSTSYSPRIVTDGLVMYVDFANPRSYISGSLTGSNLVNGSIGSMSIAALPLYSTDGGGSARFSVASSPSLLMERSTDPKAITVVCWFYATQSNSNGKMVGFDSNLGQYDRHLYMTQSGSVTFGIYTGGATRVATSPIAYNDSKWHHAVGTYTTSSTSMSLYIDGTMVAQHSSSTVQNYTGYWRIGGGQISGWPNVTENNFQGYLGHAMAYHRVLSPTEVLQNFNATRGRFGV